MNINTAALDDAVLVFLHLTLHDHNRARKGFDWECLNRLYERGFIGDPVSKTKFVILTNDGLRKNPERLFRQLFSTAGSKID
ncbi:DUF6429 family protein [Caballeronia cordobensis]|uniref:DUF6429 family protein n=1 Tax=Caballeronia cordobensis TaxID=1353886 RepID=UPI00045F0B3F|nr:putative uncharacterized protein [Burkholderia sp. RPE67]